MKTIKKVGLVKAISPVIATVIIVAVAIAISIAVALWISGVVGGMTRTERLDITAAYVSNTNYDVNESATGDEYWEITLVVNNKGSADTSIDMVFVNNKPLGTNEYGRPTTGTETETWYSNVGGTPPVPINAGGQVTLYIYLDKDTYKSGQNIQIVVHTSTGGQYPAQVTLP